jgi:hypothetical protein
MTEGDVSTDFNTEVHMKRMLVASLVLIGSLIPLDSAAEATTLTERWYAKTARNYTVKCRWECSRTFARARIKTCENRAGKRKTVNFERMGVKCDPSVGDD